MHTITKNEIPTITRSNLTLTRIKHAVFASEETDCFAARICINGKDYGQVSNDGHGGCNIYDSREAHEALMAYALTLPQITTTIGDGVTFCYQPDADSVIGDLFTDWLTLKQYRAVSRTRLLFTKPGSKNVYQTKAWTHAFMKALLHPMNRTQLESMKTKLGAAIILNTLPEADALVLFKATGDLDE